MSHIKKVTKSHTQIEDIKFSIMQIGGFAYKAANLIDFDVKDEELAAYSKELRAFSNSIGTKPLGTETDNPIEMNKFRLDSQYLCKLLLKTNHLLVSNDEVKGDKALVEAMHNLMYHGINFLGLEAKRLQGKSRQIK